jgi:PAS domain S-box-containing protein
MFHVLLLAPQAAEAALIREAFLAPGDGPAITVVSSLPQLHLRLQQGGVDLVMCEAEVPQATVEHLLQELAGTSAVPILVLCRPHERERAHQLVAMGADDYAVQCEATLADLPHVAERCLQAWQDRRQLHLAETDLAKSEERFQALAGSTRDFVWEVDASGVYTYVSPQVQNLFGYPPAEVIGRTAYAFLSPDDAQRLNAKFAQVAQHRRPISRWENSVRHPDGHRVILETSGVPIIGVDGTFRGFRGIDRDITARYQAEQELRRREAILQAVAEAAHQLLQETTGSLDLPRLLRLLGEAADVSRVYLFANRVDEQGRLTMNQCFEWAATGVSSELQNPDLQALPYAPDFTTWQAKLAAGVAVAAHVRELPAVPQALLHAQQIRSLLLVPVFVAGAWWGFIGLDECRDERAWSTGESDAVLAAARILGAALQRQQSEATMQRLAATIEQAAEAICITDLQGHIVYVNAAYEQTAGAGRERLVGQLMPLLRQDDTADETSRAIWRTLRRHEVWASRVAHSRSDGTTRHEDTLISAIRDSHGHPVNYLVVMRDVTKEVELEEQLRHALKMESVGRLAGGVAHDFNNLLSVILGYADMALAHLPADHALRDMVTEIRKAGERATALTHQLLAFSRKQVLEMKSVNLNRIVEDTRKMLVRLIGEEIELATALDPALDNVRADAAQMQQILVNLAVNARDAMTSGRGHLRITTANLTLAPEDPRLTPDLTPGTYVALTVSDDGHGMDAETLHRIFEPFFTTKARGKGTGLGLATVHGIVKQHGGEIQVTSTVGQGTTFVIYLRSETLGKELGDTTVEDQHDPHGTETILLVEDDYNVLGLARRVLERYGYQVLPADSGDAALRLALNYHEPIHLLLTDVIMPRMNGRELYDQLRPHLPHLRVLYMSGYADTQIASRGILPEDSPFLAKPFTIAALTDSVRLALDHRN